MLTVEEAFAKYYSRANADHKEPWDIAWCTQDEQDEIIELLEHRTLHGPEPFPLVSPGKLYIVGSHYGAPMLFGREWVSVS